MLVAHYGQCDLCRLCGGRPTLSSGFQVTAPREWSLVRSKFKGNSIQKLIWQANGPPAPAWLLNIFD